MANISTLGQALSLIEQIKQQQNLFSTLSTQLATGKKTQKFSGLNADVLVSKRARADFAALDTYKNNITNASRRIDLMVSALEGFKAQAENFQGALLAFSQQSAHQDGEIVYWDDPTTPDVEESIPVGYDTDDPDVDFASLQTLAGSIKGFLVDLVNSKDGDRFLFSGADTGTAPLTDTGTLDAAVATMINGWKTGTITNDELFANFTDRTTDDGNTDALTDTVMGYNAALSSGNVNKVYVQISQTSELDYTVLGNADALRDILAVASYLSNDSLPPMADEVEIDPGTGLPVVLTDGAPGSTIDESKDNFFAVFNDMVKMVSDAVDNIDQLRFNLENTRARLEQVKQDYSSSQNALLNTIGEVEDVNIDEVAVRLTTLQIQLDASYRVTARLQDLSLVNFF